MDHAVVYVSPVLADGGYEQVKKLQILQEIYKLLSLLLNISLVVLQ